ncbi:MAG: M23 family metallopeptidase [Lachnospiraceae bacterium]|jgi:murein DD-endopeptidase MepM/ murein hydrolase activator NlpD|nr:M23 family metallopeptidase [Lachnospiraceae bacterium]
MFQILNVVKSVFIHLRASIKIVVLLAVGTFLIIGLLNFFYRPIYSVTLNGEFIGYVQNKNVIAQRIENYAAHGDADNVAFVNIPAKPEYSLCLLKKDKVANEEEIFNTVKQTGTVYYRYYAVLVGNEEKIYVSTQTEAESIINQLKEKNSSNKTSLAYTEKTEPELKQFTEVSTAVASLYVKPVVTSYQVAGSGSVTRTTGVNKGAGVSIGMNFVKPTSGVLTSRFGVRNGSNHTGIDIGNSQGTPILAAAAGTVKYTGWYSGYGNIVMLSHSNGVETWYGHCSVLYVKAGQTVSAGQKIAGMGSTGNSTGNHLHFEVIVNGVKQNPQSYVF